MQGLRGLAVLLLCQCVGEVLARGLRLPLPGPVLGMLLMLLLLNVPALREPAGAAAEQLLQHLSLLFVPVGVGVVTHLGLLSQYGLRIVVVLVLSTLVGLAVTALVLQLLMRASAGGATPGPTPAAPTVQE